MSYALSPGSSIGDYEVIRKIAEGGMGQVYLIKPKRRVNGIEFGKTFVLKGVPCYSRTDANESLQEAKVLRGLQHEHIVQYVDVFPHDLGSNMLAVCTVMEYCECGDLAEHLRMLRGKQQPFLAEPVLRLWLEQLLRALDHLHSSGVLHRDLKPHNVFITAVGRLKLGDFGLATALARGKIRSRVGTPSYIAPEVLQTVRAPRPRPKRRRRRACPRKKESEERRADEGESAPALPCRSCSPMSLPLSHVAPALTCRSRSHMSLPDTAPLTPRRPTPRAISPLLPPPRRIPAAPQRDAAQESPPPRPRPAPQWP